MPRDESEFEEDAVREACEDDLRTLRMLRDWRWAELLVQRPLPLCLVTGV